MSKLSFKTRGNSAPQGKPRVWFCAHPEDYKRCFEAVTDEILAKQNCTVYYDTEPMADFDEAALLDDLREMQLFVMPVTARLLNTDNRAIRVEFRAALEHHIPVLPLMQENGLSERFNEVCGDLQYLDKHANDRTAISYDEKLERYLSSVLIGDELAEQVRRAFDAYIFLSYRKKDRAFAQELMRLIHKNGDCRDIAIWYDEFLTPGENFNTAIGEALHKSALFALAVTPNLVNEQNYVMTTEYPMAKQAGKTILPAEIVPTDRASLEEHYADIPACTDAHDDAALSRALTQALQSIAVRENDDDPMHNFFIGLAYLGGIDVEVDHERALSLITSAAEAELPEAIDKLIAMYRNGEGVERDYETSITWQERLVEVRRRAFEQTDDGEVARAYVGSLWELGDYIYELRQIDRAAEVFARMNAVCEELCQRDTQSWARRERGISYNKLADIQRAKGRLDGAETYYLRGAEQLLSLVEETDSHFARRDLAISYDGLGYIKQVQGVLDEAEHYYRRGLAIDEIIVRETGSTQARHDLAIRYDDLGDTKKEQGKLDEAEGLYQKATALFEAVVSEGVTASRVRDLYINYSKRGAMKRAQGDLEGAASIYERGMRLVEILAKDVGTVEARRDLAVCCDNLGNVKEKQGKADEAEALYRKGLENFRAIAEQTGTVEARRDLAISYSNLGNLCVARGRKDDAPAYYRKSIALFEELAEEMGTVRARRDLASMCNNLGAIMMSQGKAEEAEPLLRRGIAIGEALTQETGTIENYDTLARAYVSLGMLDEKHADYLKRAWDIWSRLSEQCPDQPEFSRMLGVVRREMNKHRSLDAFVQPSASAVRSPRELGSKAERLERESQIEQFMGKSDKARSMLREALDIWTGLAEQYPNQPEFAAKRDALRAKLGLD